MMNNNTNMNEQAYVSVREQSMNELQNMYAYFSQKQAAYDEFDRLDMQVSMNSRPVSKAGKAWGIILLIIGGLIFFISVGASGGSAFIIGLILIGLGILLIALRSKKIKNMQNMVNNSARRMEEIAQELAVHYNNYGYCQLGLEFTFPRTIGQIYEVIRQGRADTIKEAMNLIVYDEHNAEMERLQRTTAQAAWETCAASRATAGFAAANYFQNRNR